MFNVSVKDDEIYVKIFLTYYRLRNKRTKQVCISYLRPKSCILFITLSVRVSYSIIAYIAIYKNLLNFIINISSPNITDNLLDIPGIYRYEFLEC